MSSEWMIDEKEIAGKTLYQVYRLIDQNKSDTRTNREVVGGYYENLWCAERLRNVLNKEG